VALGESVKIGEKVVVVGGGNAAIDAARTAFRLGAKEVTIAYRRTRAEMPAQEEEIEEAEHEGIKIEYLTAPTQLLIENGQIKGMECIRMKLVIWTNPAGSDHSHPRIRIQNRSGDHHPGHQPIL
jgi:NADPH-dependent glutamate synthase beta subunit-like oxidoreductase